jgi:hypothetical protein
MHFPVILRLAVSYSNTLCDPALTQHRLRVVAGPIAEPFVAVPWLLAMKATINAYKRIHNDLSVSHCSGTQFRNLKNLAVF